MLFYFLSLLSKNQSNEITEQSDSTRLDRPVNNNIFGHSWTINHPYTLNSTKEIDYTYITNHHLFNILGWNLKSRVGRSSSTAMIAKRKRKGFQKGAKNPNSAAYQREQRQPPRDPSTGDASASCVDTSICSIATTSCSSTNSTANAQTLPNLQSQTRRESAHLRHCRHVANQNGNQILLK